MAQSFILIIDIMPTVMAMLGLEPHPASQGLDVLEHQDPERIIYSVAQTPAAHQYSAIYKNWQLVFDYNTNDFTLNIASNNYGNVSEQTELSNEEQQWLLAKLQKWRSDQLAYYLKSGISTKYYPPLHDNDAANPAAVVLTEDSSD